MLAVPSNAVPPMVLDVSSAVVVAEFPVQLPDEPLVFPVTLPVMFPLKVADNTPEDAL
tara:strand:- start:11 stop:184 length:174 start_codon:yes stop_codon:yes gene_type:complete